MSESQRTESDAYPRNNFWGEMTDYDDDDDEPDQEPGDYGVGDGPDQNPGPAGTWHPDPNDPNEIIAHRLLRDTARMLCSETLFETPALEGGHIEHVCRFHFEGPEWHLGFDADEHDPDAWQEHNPEAHHTANREVELSEPRVRPPTETVRDQRHRVRVNDEVGYLSGGHSTGVVLQDRSLEELIAVVNLWLTGRQANVPESIKRDARDKAYAMKRDGEKKDVEILTAVVEFVRTETK